MKKLIIYDLDGTLVDTEEDIFLGCQHMLRTLGRPMRDRDEIRKFVGRGLHFLIGNCLQSGEKPLIEKGAEIFREYYRTHMMDHSRLYDGALEVLNYFKDRRQAVMTNKPNPFAEDMLRSLGVDGYFVKIVAGNSEFPRKPDPAAVQALLKSEMIEKGAALFVGDSLVDHQTARNAGIETALITHGFGVENELESSDPEILARGFRQFLAEVRKRGW